MEALGAPPAFFLVKVDLAERDDESGPRDLDVNCV